MTENLLVRILLYGGGIYLFLNLYALLVSDKLIFAPRPPDYDHLPNEVRIAVGDGEEINAVHLEHPDAEYTLLFSHGNAETLANVAPFMQQFYELGYSVLMYDYRGYGTSDGTPSTRKAKQDAAAAYAWLVDEKGVDPRRIIAHGRSLGGAVATWLAANREVGALIAESSFVSAFRVKTRWPLLPWDKFNSLRSMKSVDCPTLIMHGTQDRIIPFWHAEKLFAAAPDPKHHLWIEGGAHNDYAYVAEDAYLESFKAFMETVRKHQQPMANLK